MKTEIKRNFKAQFWSFDIIFAIIVFTVAIILLTFTWNSVSNQLSGTYSNSAEMMQTDAAVLSQSILSPGYPKDWTSVVNTTNVNTWSNVSIGLTNSTGSTNISSSKLYTFMAMSNYNYQDTKTTLGIGYEYYIIISKNGMNITIGKNPNTNGALTVYSYKEGARINGMPVKIHIILWTPQPIAV